MWGMRLEQATKETGVLREPLQDRRAGLSGRREEGMLGQVIKWSRQTLHGGQEAGSPAPFPCTVTSLYVYVCKATLETEQNRLLHFRVCGLGGGL